VYKRQGDNTFENPTWEIDANLKNNFIPLLYNSTTGRVKFLYYEDGKTPSSKIIDIYTKKK
jgi:hypothetical protein